MFELGILKKDNQNAPEAACNSDDIERNKELLTGHTFRTPVFFPEPLQMNEIE
jgi:hypothetical protein